MALAATAVPAEAALTFVNGNFTNFTGGTGGAPSQLNDTGTGGYTKLTGWTAGPGSSGLLAFLFASGTGDTTGSHDVRFNDTFLLWGTGDGGVNVLPASSPAGGNYVALDADSTYRGAGISQQLGGLVPGTTYVVSFWWAAAQQHGFNGATTESVQVSFGSQVKTTTTFNLADHGFSGWMGQTFNFTAQTATDTLNFLALGGPDGLPPFSLIDGVTVSGVPEPGTATLLLSAGGLLILFSRCKNLPGSLTKKEPIPFGTGSDLRRTSGAHSECVVRDSSASSDSDPLCTDHPATHPSTWPASRSTA